MSFAPRGPRSQGSRYQPRLEGLESRRLLDAATGSSLDFIGPVAPAAETIPLGSEASPWLAAASANDLSTLSVVRTSPKNGAVLAKSPAQLKITFNQAFPSFLLGVDIGLQRIADDGTVLEDLTHTLSEPWDMEPANLTVLPVTLTTTLAPGRYRIVLLGSQSMLSGIGPDGSLSIPLRDAGMDVVLGQFTVGSPGPKPDLPQNLKSAFDLGPIGAVPSVTSSTLALGSNVGNYQLFKFTLAPGHFWRLGAEVTAQRDGGTLNAALSLFDAQGRLIKTVDQGRSDAPFDPYLFAGLQAGTYYLGVSGSNNTPGQPGGYNPVTGQPGTAGIAQPGGSYRLHLVADVADNPTYLFDSQLTYADPADPRPTGIVLAFSGAMDLDSFLGAFQPDGSDRVFKGLEVVDANGQVWPLTPVGYDESLGRFAFLFEKPLPQGRYSLRVSATGGITDLAGLAPVAKGAGQGTNAQGVLTSWTVNGNLPNPNANNLGTILSSSSHAPTVIGLVNTGESTSYRFVVPTSGFYMLDGQFSNLSYRVSIVGSDGTTLLQLPGRAGSLNTTIQLTPGVYSLRFDSIGSEPVNFSIQLSRKNTSPESLFENGVGQGSALNLTLIRPTALEPTFPPVIPPLPPTSPPPSVPSGSSVIAGPSPYQPGPSSGIPGTPHSPLSLAPFSVSVGHSSSATGLVLTLGGGTSLVGSPLAGAEHIAAVGPGTASGGTALAANSIGVLQGINLGSNHEWTASNRSGESLLNSVVLTGDEGFDDSPELDGAEWTRNSSPQAAPEIAEGRTMIASTSDWLGGFGAALLNWLAPSTQATTTTPESDPQEPTPDRIVLTADDQLTPVSEEQVEHAGFAAPLSLGVVSLLALRLQSPVRRWLGQRRGRNGRHRTLANSPVGSPHRRA